MAHITRDKVLETATGSGTTAFTLAGAVTGFRSFSTAGLVASDTCFYAATQVDASGNPSGNWECGLGTLASGTSLTRTTVFASSNANAAVTFTGTVYVALGLPSVKSVQMDNVNAVLLPAATAEPGTPAAGNLYVYAREIAPGWVALKNKRPSGVDSPLQDSLTFNGFAMWRASNNALVAIGAAALTAAGTATAVTPASGSAKSQVRRVQYASAATAGAITTFVAPNAGATPVFRGNVAGEGGFRFVNRFALNAVQTGNRFFSGLADSITAQTGAAVDPTTNTTPGKVGLALNASTGNWQLVRNITGTAPTVVDLGANFPVDTTSLMELLLFCRPHNGTAAGDIGYRVRRYTTASDSPAFETSGTLTTNIPAATTLLHPYAFFSNNATAAAVSWHIVMFGLESDW